MGLEGAHPQLVGQDAGLLAPHDGHPMARSRYDGRAGSMAEYTKAVAWVQRPGVRPAMLDRLGDDLDRGSIGMWNGVFTPFTGRGGQGGYRGIGSLQGVFTPFTPFTVHGA